MLGSGFKGSGFKGSGFRNGQDSGLWSLASGHWSLVAGFKDSRFMF
jgi:hypothetical protein